MRRAVDKMRRASRDDDFAFRLSTATGARRRRERFSDRDGAEIFLPSRGGAPNCRSAVLTRVPHPLRRFWRWFAKDEKSWVPRPRCPICGREVVRFNPTHFRGDRGWSGYWPTEREFLIAHCPVHRPPLREGRKRRR